MIYHFNTLFGGKDIGKYYNACCRIVPDGEWICFWDSDVMLFNTFAVWNDFLEQAIAEYPDVKLFSCVSNRIGTHKQRFLPVNDSDPDILHHRRIAEEIYKNNGLRIRTDVGSVSGIMLLFRKDIWKAVGGFVETGILGVDTDFSKAISGKGWKIGVLQGLYATHYYRLAEGSGGHLGKITT